MGGGGGAGPWNIISFKFSADNTMVYGFFDKIYALPLTSQYRDLMYSSHDCEILWYVLTSKLGWPNEGHEDGV